MARCCLKKLFSLPGIEFFDSESKGEGRGTMTKIRFTCENDRELLEKAHRIIVLNGMVIYTPEKWTYKIPNWICGLLDKEGVSYEIVGCE